MIGLQRFEKKHTVHLNFFENDSFITLSPVSFWRAELCKPFN